jgi:hypothetical protein
MNENRDHHVKRSKPGSAQGAHVLPSCAEARLKDKYTYNLHLTSVLSCTYTFIYIKEESKHDSKSVTVSLSEGTSCRLERTIYEREYVLRKFIASVHESA